MQPIDLLITEHRLIERMIVLMRQELTRIKDNVAVDPEFAFVDGIFIDIAVDFLRTYADRCHHGKEEEILFAALAQKQLSSEQRQVMEELSRDHAWARKATANLVKAKENYLREQKGALEELMQYWGELVEFYPKHLEKEEQHFFVPCMAHFNEPEKADLLQKMGEFDRRLIHEKYQQVVAGIENRRACRI